MIDTVRLATENLELDPSNLMRRGWAKTTNETWDCEGQVKETAALQLKRKGESPHYLAYYPDAGALVVETSLPKTLYGQNWQMLGPRDVDRALDELGNRVNDLVGGSVPHAGEWDIRGRADFVYSWDARWADRDHVGDYLTALDALEMPRHTSGRYSREGTVFWENHSQYVRCYSKEREARYHREPRENIAASSGLLRFECELKSHVRRDLERLGGVTDMKAKNVLNWPVAKAVLENYVQALHIDLEITTEEQLTAALVREMGPYRARRALGYIYLTTRFSRDQLRELGIDRRLLSRDGKLLNQAGFCAGVSKTEPLPPLVLPSKYDGSPRRLHH